MKNLNQLILGVCLTAVALSIGGCASTIRGAGQDTAKDVDATQNAVRRTGRAIRN